MFETQEKVIRKSSLKLLWLIGAIIARTAWSNEVCSEIVYLGGDFGIHQGRFSSPGYPSGTYPSREKCTWIIKVPLNYRVLLHFDGLDVESCPTATNNCTCDYVTVSDGQLLRDRLLAKVCGTKPPLDIISSGRFVRVDLVTDESNERNFKGFSVQFYSISPDGATPTSIDERDTRKNKKTVPPEQDGPEKGGSSTIMIAVVCSLGGVAIIGIIFVCIYMKTRKQAQANHAPRGHPSASFQRTQEPSRPPPPYSSVVPNAPPPYSSTASLG